MSRERLYLFDTTLRDGAQTNGVDFTLADKLAIARMLDELGVDYVEAGYPGANPTDTSFFAEKRPARAKITAFGMTRRPGRSASNDPGLAALLAAEADAICFVAKSWDYQVRVALETNEEENLASIRDSVRAAKAKGREVLLDCEHFFDGYKANPAYALTCAKVVQMMVGRRIDNLFPKTIVPIGAPVLEARDIVRHPMTKSVSLTVRAGEIVGLAGLVGSGRSELAQTLFGITPAESGEIRLMGEGVTIRSAENARSKGIAYVPEDRGVQGLVRRMSVLHNFSLAALGALSRGGFINRSAERRMAEEGVARFRVKTSSVEEIAGRLSGGNQQKIVLGKWLANNPKLLILDEPTRGIDVGAKAEIHRLMSELAGAGVAILMISSELPEVLGMSDRVLVMREGRLVAEFDRAHATSETVGAAMMGETASVERAA